MGLEMNAYLAALMDKPSLRPGYCVRCGRTPVTGHHLVPRSQGGVHGPVWDLCGHGTAGCHGLAEDKMLHPRWVDGWEYLRTAVPTKYEKALDLPGWRRL
jgi:hypothetical protein